MATSFFFYDLETSGFSPRTARIMQFAGIRTDMKLNPIGDPINYFIKLTADILPDPDAVLLTGITPQQTLAEGVSEAEFLKLFYKDIVKPGTIFVGFNNVRFDDEFMRFLNYRNFYDAYGWQWKDSCSRWDLLDVIRMTRALRPDGIKWPFAPDGKPSNRLEYLTSVNKISHIGAHDALSDVYATIEVAKLIYKNQPELFNYLLNIRSKNQVKDLVTKGEPFIYTSGHFSSSYLHTTAVVLLSLSPTPDACLVYDLRYNPEPYLNMSIDELINIWKYSADPDAVRLPVKTLKFNRLPAIAPLGVIKDKETQKRIGLDLDTIAEHLSILKKHHTKFAKQIISATEKLNKLRDLDQVPLISQPLNVDEKLYDGFIDKHDVEILPKVRLSEPAKLSELIDTFNDTRLKTLLPLYKARNYQKSLASNEAVAWHKFCQQKLTSGGNSSQMAKYFLRLDELAKGKVSKQKQYLLEELRLYGQSIVP